MNSEEHPNQLVDEGTIDPPLQRIRDITPGSPWPQHVTDLISRRNLTVTDVATTNSNAAQNVETDVPITIRLDEITACLCHTAMVEVGFVPSHHAQIDPTEIRFMTDKERIVRLVSQFPPQQRNSNAGIITCSYRAICENPKNLITRTFRRDVEHQESATVVDQQQAELSPEETEPLYIYTNLVDVVMLAQNGTLSLHGHVTYEDPTDASQRKSIHIDVNIRKFLPANCSVRNFDVNALLPSQQWLSQIQLNGSSLSDTLKVEFAKVLLTLVDGISFEPGLQHMSPELLMNVFQFLPIEDVCHVTQVSHYMYAVSDNDLFWMKRIERDFPADAPAIRARFLTSNSSVGSNSDKEDNTEARAPTKVTSTTNINAGEESIYREYVRLYQTHRPPRRRLFHPIYRRLLIPRRSFTPLLGLHPPLLRRFW